MIGNDTAPNPLRRNGMRQSGTWFHPGILHSRNNPLRSALTGALNNRMVEYQKQDLDQVFHALADPTRRAMVRQLASGQQTVTELARPYEMSLAAASKHLKVLEGAGLMTRIVQGRSHRCSLDARPLAQALAWLRSYTDFWDERLDVLDELLSTRAAPKDLNERD